MDDGSLSNYNSEQTCTSPREGFHVLEDVSIGIQEDLQTGAISGSEFEEAFNMTSEDEKESEGKFFFFSFFFLNF
jgi:DNA-binding winged helix-turn-helix (wHTH) protein